MNNQDTTALGLGTLPHDQSNNSFVSALHGPNHADILNGAPSEVPSSEVYESFSFIPNSMMSFYPL